MSTAPSRKMFLNLPVRDSKRSVDFFTTLGFTFDPRFTDESATCMIVGEDAFVMLLVEPFFKTFTKRQLCDTRTHTEGLVAISAGSRAEVDRPSEPPAPRAAPTPSTPRTTASCTAGASTIPTATTGRCSGWMLPQAQSLETA